MTGLPSEQVVARMPLSPKDTIEVFEPVAAIEPATAVATVADAFDYSVLHPGKAAEARGAAMRIRVSCRVHIVETGRELTTMKASLGHSTFLKWISAEFDMTNRTAENYMNAARLLIGKSETVSNLPPSTLYRLASKSAPTAIVESILAEVEAGALMTTKQIRARLADHHKGEGAQAGDRPVGVGTDVLINTPLPIGTSDAVLIKDAEHQRTSPAPHPPTRRLVSLAEKMGESLGRFDLSELIDVMQRPGTVQYDSLLKNLRAELVHQSTEPT
jgi:hypothetical protein